jgi:hypothetical protein
LFMLTPGMNEQYCSAVHGKAAIGNIQLDR